VDRTPEPELMDDAEQARAYAEADFAEPNSAFVQLVEDKLAPLPAQAKVVDLGCGPADIPMRLSQRHPSFVIDAVDGSQAMLDCGARAVKESGARVNLICARVGELTLPHDSYDLVLSNSLLHHLPEPSLLWRTVRELAAPGARVLVMDLARPDTPVRAQELVDQYAANEPEVLRRDFLASLHAAFTVAEVRAQLVDADLSALSVEATSDRHLCAWGTLA
jgi:ubiquinone/menaquinone biosynthesis C-methylase UbiE